MDYQTLSTLLELLNSKCKGSRKNGTGSKAAKSIFHSKQVHLLLWWLSHFSDVSHFSDGPTELSMACEKGVYRKDPDSSFYGVYIFGDFNTRRVWGLRQSVGKLIDVRELGTAPGGIASFGVGDRDEILLVTYDGGIYHLDLASTSYD